MVKTIKVDPITRIEGHLGIEVEIGDDNVITEAKSECSMFRGFEKIMVDRDPRDPPVLLQRICGVCHEVHRITGEKAVEDAAGVTVPRGAEIMRNLVEAVTTIYSHAAHTYVLCAPDYVAAMIDAGLSTRWKPGVIDSQAYMEAVAQQRKLHEALAILGGKVPHNMTPVPGGFSFTPTINEALAIKTIAIEVSEWVGPTMKAPDVLGLILKEVEEGALGKYESECLAMGHALNDAVRLLAFLHLQGAKDWGVGPGNFISFGCYDMADGSLLEPRGVYDGSKVIDGDLSAEDFAANITESTASSLLEAPDASTPMFDEPVTSAKLGKGGAYTFAKAPRYKGMTVESGPLARLVVAGLDPFDLRAAYGGGANESNVFNRICARVQETLFLRDWILGVGVFEGKTSLADELVAAIASGTMETYAKFEVPQSGKGVGLWEAPRGATGHWTTISNKKVSNYQVIAGTGWNTTPRDENGQLGTIEEALIGTPVDPANPALNVGRVVRSFDPCLACTVHVQTPNGKKYTVNMGF